MAYSGQTKYDNVGDNEKNSNAPVKPGQLDDLLSAKLVKDKVSGKKTIVASESITLPAGVAGTKSYISTEYDFVLDNSGSFIGDKDNSSLSITSTAITGSEEDYDYDLSPQGNADAITIQGNYRYDYLSGVLCFNKADASTAGTVDYIIRVQGSDVNIGSITYTGAFNVEAFQKTSGVNEDATVFATEEDVSAPGLHLWWLGTGGYDRINDYFRAIRVNESGTSEVAPGPSINGYKSYEDDSFVAGDSPVIHDINTDLGRNGNIGYIVCDGPGDILIEISQDGSTYGDQFTLKSGESYSLDNHNIDSIRITHSGSDSAYRINVR